MKYHLTDQGPKPCTASQRLCPLGGEHYDSLQAAHKAMEIEHESLKSVRKQWVGPNSLQGSVMATISPMAGGRYYGSHIEAWTILPHLDAFREAVGDDRAELMELNKELRDRGRVYHMTVVGPPEMRELGKDHAAFPEQVKINYLGIGSASDGKAEAWFVVCTSEEIARWREANGLGPKDLHITLGFDPKDVHSEPKGESSLRVS